MEKSRYDYTINGTCPESCHECCTNFLTVSEKEIEKIKEYLWMNGIRGTNPNTVFTGFIDRCPFVNRAGKCDIYEVRPEICSYFQCNRMNEYRPFNHANKKVVNMVKEFCPNAYIPSDMPDEKELNSIYQAKKKMAGIKTRE